MKSLRKRFDEIDLLEVIAIFMVIVLHTDLLHFDFLQNPGLPSLAQFGARILMEGVPIFVIANGFLLMNKPYDKKKHFRKVRKIAILMVVWAILNYISGVVAAGVNGSVDDFLKNFFILGSNTKFFGILWFLVSLLAIYIVFPVIKSLHDNDRKTYNYFFKVVAFFTVGVLLLSTIVSFANLWLQNKGLTLIPNFFAKFSAISSSTGYFLFCFMLGGYLQDYREKLKKVKVWKILLCAFVSFALSFGYGVCASKMQGKMIASSYNYGSIFLIINIVCLYALLLRYKDKGYFYNKLIQDISKNTLGIYFIHVIIIRCLNYLVDFPKENFGLRLCFSLAVFAISYLVVKLIRLIPVVRKTVEI